MKVALRAPNGLYVTAEDAGGIDARNPATPVALRARGTQVDAWQQFEKVDAGGGWYGLRTSDGYFLTADISGLMRTDSTVLGAWEQFRDDGGEIVTWDGVHVLTLEGSGFVVDSATAGDDPVISCRGRRATFQVEVIEPDVVPLPPADRRSFRASFCSHHDAHGEKVFDPVFFGVMWSRGDIAAIDDVLATKASLGITACILCVQGSYGDYLDGDSFDFRADPTHYGDLCRYIRDRGFVPIILVGTADGGTWEEIYDGTMAAVLDAVKDLAPDAWFCAGYEQDLDRGGGYSARQMDDALALMREKLGAEALLLLWLQPTRCTPASYWGSNKDAKPTPPDWNPVELKWITSDENPNEGAWIEADDPYGGGEQEAYYRSHGVEIDGLFYQTDHGHSGPSYANVGGQPGLDQYGQPVWIDRVIECADRFLPRGTPMPGAKGHIDGSGITHTSDVCPSTSAPDWFHDASRKRGRPLFIIGETVAYEYLRDQCCDEAVQECCEMAASLGLPAPQGSFQAY